jgi:hypothetical protein
MKLKKLISGGQTGADRAALMVAHALGFPSGGSCPKGRKAEDGRIPDIYPLEETSSSQYPPRTRKNIEDSDGTVIFTRGGLERGSKLTAELCKEYRKPYLHIDLNFEKGLAREVASRAANFVEFYNIEVLNIAGNRESTSPGICQDVEVILLEMFLLIL